MPSNTALAVEARHEKFRQEFKRNGGNATQAAIFAGFAPHSAEVTGAKLAKRYQLREAARTHEQTLLEKSRLETERVLEELRRIVFADPRKFYNADGSLKSVVDLDDDTAAALSSLDVDEIKEGRGSKMRVVGMTTKIRMHDKLAAIDKAMRYLGLFEKDNRSKAPSLAIQINSVAAPDRGSARDAHVEIVAVPGPREKD